MTFLYDKGMLSISFEKVNEDSMQYKNIIFIINNREIKCETQLVVSNS